jgi:hypothetical protein
MNPLPILRDAWYFYSRNLLSIALLCLPLLAIEAVVTYLLGQSLAKEQVMPYSLMVGLMFSPLYNAALILFLASRTTGQFPPLTQLWAAALRLWPVYALLTGLSAMLLMLGLSLLVLPGVWLMVKISFAEFLLVLRGRSPLDALRESFTLTRGHFWQILLCMFAVMIPLWGISAWLFRPEGGFNPEDISSLPWQVLIGFGQLFTTVVLFRFFMLAETPTRPSVTPGESTDDSRDA